MSAASHNNNNKNNRNWHWLNACCVSGSPSQASNKGSCLHQTLTFHLQWGKSLASEHSAPVCSLEHPFPRIWGPAQQPLASAWITAKGGRNSPRPRHPEQGETRKAIRLTSFLQRSLLTLSAPRRPPSSNIFFVVPITSRNGRVHLFFSVMQLPWTQGSIFLSCALLDPTPTPRTVCGPEQCSMKMCWMKTGNEGEEGRGATPSNGKDSPAPLEPLLACQMGHTWLKSVPGTRFSKFIRLPPQTPLG